MQAQVWGLGRVAALEHPDRWGGLIDLPPVLDERAAARLCAVLAGCGEDQVAIRPAGIFGRRLARAPRPDGAGDRWAPRGTVLVTGGTGAIGGHVARWLAGRGAARVVLASRSGPAAPGAAALAARAGRRRHQRGRRGRAISAERADVAGLLTRISAGGPPLTAVMHAAGAGQSTASTDMTVAELGRVLAAKAAGAAHLDELTARPGAWTRSCCSPRRRRPGAAGSRRDTRRRTRSWTRWPSAAGRGAWPRPRWPGACGAAAAWATRKAGSQLRRRGLRMMDPALALRLLGQALDGGEALLTVADVDWDRFAPAFTVRRPSPLLAGLPEAARALAAAETVRSRAGRAGPAAGGQVRG